MVGRLIVHDLPDFPLGPEISDGVSTARGGDTVFSALPSVGPCTGCYGCWLVTPGRCVKPGRAQEFPRLMASADELVVVSRLVCGGFSPEIKAVLDHSIGYMLPFFSIVRGETHHPMRAPGRLSLKYLFYGNDLSERWCGIARELTAANALNLDAHSFETCFYPSGAAAAKALGL